jgi:hypothetical protein
MCLNKIRTIVRIGKYFSDALSIQIDLKQEILYRRCFLTLLYNMPLARANQSDDGG